MKGEERYMREALRLASLMEGRTAPDPTVGAVVVKNGRIVGKGYHREVGTPHAEAVALSRAGARSRGATLYVSLEPCSHYGNNPPCADQIIAAGIKKVVAPIADPNPLVSGRGFKKLKAAGLRVEVGCLSEEAKRINEPFFKYITKNMPFVTLKSAMSLDGKIATSSGESKWISSVASRKTVHSLRAKTDAVMTAIGTVLADDPRLTVRAVKGRNPIKVVIDPELAIPLGANVLKNEPWKAIIVTSTKVPKSKIAALRRLDAEVIEMKSKGNMIDLRAVMKELAKRHIMSVMIEAGGGLAATALQAGIVDKIMYFVAPKIIGGKGAPTPVEGEGARKLSRAVKLKDIRSSKSGEDVLIVARPV